MSRRSRLSNKKRKKEKRKAARRFLNITYIAEFPVQNRKRICKDKLATYKNSIQTTTSCQISEVESTFNVKGYRSYFNSQVKDWSQQLYCPTETDCVDLLSNCSNTFSHSMERNSWFSVKRKIYPQRMNFPKIFSQSTPCSYVECKENEQLKIEKEDCKEGIPPVEQLLMTNKLRMRYNAKQRKLLRMWIGSCRLAYNMVTAHYKYSKRLNTLKFYRTMLKSLSTNKTFLRDVPYNSLDETLKEAMANIKTVISLQLANPNSRQGIPFRCRKALSQVLPIRAQNLSKDLKAYPRLLFKKDMGPFDRYIQNIRKNTNYRSEKCPRDSKLIWKRKLNHWFLCLVTKVEKDSRENQANEKIISIDPGNRTFATCYSPSGELWKVGEGDGRVLVKLCLRMDKLMSLASKANHNKRRNLNKALERLKMRLKNLRTEFHNKFINWLTTNFSTIVLPKFNTHLMSRRRNRKIGAKTVRGLMTWGHGMFREKLTQVCRYKSINLYNPSEAYTSKTCSYCGWINEKLGGKEIFKCDNCKKNIDRDVNGARGIYLRALKESAVSSENGFA